mmetsp:Transcript_12926/g.33195  ORF Transcript_12926/g.33195 Transcript_12926/m.33195 type:complete len:352 (-) Transcript_12926:1046-2101(-)
MQLEWLQASDTCHCLSDPSSPKETVDHLLCIQAFQIYVCLAATDKHHWSTAGVHHGNSGTHLVVDGVKLGEHNTVNGPRARILGICQVSQALIELGELIDCIVSNECLTNKKHQLGLVQADEMRESTHQRVVILHAAGGVHQQNVCPLPLGLFHALKRNLGGVLFIAPLIQGHPEALTMSAELLHRPGTKGVTCGNHDLHVVLHQPVRNLSQIGGLAHTIDPNKGDDVGSFPRLGTVGLNLAQNVDRARRSEDADQRLLHRCVYHLTDASEGRYLLAFQAKGHAVRNFAHNVMPHVALHQLLLQRIQGRLDVAALQRLPADDADLEGAHHTGQEAALLGVATVLLFQLSHV